MRPGFSKKGREQSISDVIKFEDGIESIVGNEILGNGNARTVSTMVELDEERARKIAREEAELAAERLAKKRQKEEEEASSGGDLGISPRALKGLENMANAFVAMKKVFSNPLQDAVENKIGGRAAEVVERVFSPPSGEPAKKDIVEVFLNSQFAFGLGSGLGQRGPEVIDKVTSIYGPDKAERWIGDIVNKGGRIGGGGAGGVGGGTGVGGTGGVGGGMSASGAGSDQQSERDLVLSLSPDNPEHVSAYAASQGGLQIDVARKMLMIHQDAFIEDMKKRGMDVGKYDNVQEYRPPISQDLMPITPAQEDNRIDRRNPELERQPGPSIADIGRSVSTDIRPDDMQNVEGIEQQLVDRKVDVDKKADEKTNDNKTNGDDIAEYLKNMNEYIFSLKEMVEKQNNDISSLRGELDALKRPVIEKGDGEKGSGTGSGTKVVSANVIRKGYAYVKKEKEEEKS